MVVQSDICCESRLSNRQEGRISRGVHSERWVLGVGLPGELAEDGAVVASGGP